MSSEDRISELTDILESILVEFQSYATTEPFYYQGIAYSVGCNDGFIHTVSSSLSAKLLKAYSILKIARLGK